MVSCGPAISLCLDTSRHLVEDIIFLIYAFFAPFAHHIYIWFAPIISRLLAEGNNNNNNRTKNYTYILSSKISIFLPRGGEVLQLVTIESRPGFKNCLGALRNSQKLIC